jgi:hypothetical protein
MAFNWYNLRILSLRHEAMHEKHKGHESMHAEMILVLLMTLVVSQILLVIWKTKHFKSFQVIKKKLLLFTKKLLINYRIFY